MKLNNLSFPYPIIASAQDWRDDYVESSYQTSFDDQSNIDDNKFEFTFTHMLSSMDINNLIDQRLACFAVQVYCKQTLVNKVFTTFDKQQTVEMPLNYLYGSFSLTPQVIVLDEITNFSPEDLHEEFGETSFDLKAGDVLAHDAPVELQCDFEKTARESLVKVKLSTDLDPTVYEIATDHYYIVIYMGKAVHEVWTSLASDSQNSGAHIFMSIYKDLNYYVLNEIVRDPSNEEELWGKAWMRSLGELGLKISEDADFNEINRLAQRLVANKGVDRLHKLLAKGGVE